MLFYTGRSSPLLPSGGNVDVLPDGVRDLGVAGGLGLGLGEDVPHVRGRIPPDRDIAGRLRGTRRRPLQVHTQKI